MRFGAGFMTRRSSVIGTSGAVATSTPTAALAGYDVLKGGGNAADAALAMAACLVVSEPTSNGLGSDLFAIIWDGFRLHGLNASGRAPLALDANALRDKGLASVPLTGWEPVTVPGMVDGWALISERFGSMGLDEVLEPAARLAEYGYPVSQVTASFWDYAASRFGSFEGFAKAFMPGGRAPFAGEVYKNERMAESIRAIGQSKGRCFYEGYIADAIARASEKEGGYIRKEDLLAHRSEWVDPISAGYKGYEVYEMPPNGQGIVALMALKMLDGMGLEKLGYDDPLRINLIADALRLAFADAARHISDPSFYEVPVGAMLSDDYTQERAGLLRRGTAIRDIKSGLPVEGGTVYLSAADKNGMMVSLIQSNYMGFGSGIVIAEHGISMQNRGVGFSLEKGHPNELKPGKRPYHTIIPGFLMKGGRPVGPFGVMGGDMQPQGHVQLISAIADMGLDPQSGIDMPRFRVSGDMRLHLEKGLSNAKDALEGMGYEVRVEESSAMFGGGQMIMRGYENGTYVAGTESRKDGLALAF